MLNKYKNILDNKKEVYLRIKARPGAGKTILKEIMDDDTIKIDITAPPERNKANMELISFLAEIFNINKNNIAIISGRTEKLKLIKIKK